MSDLPVNFNRLLNYRSMQELVRMDDAARRDLLLELLEQNQSEATWLAICELLAAWPEGEEKDDALAVADRALDSWDDRLRRLSSAWRYLYAGEGLASLVRLVRSIDLYRREENGSHELWTIVNSERVQNLRYLTVYRSELASPTVRALSDSPYLANLQYLEIRRTSLFGEDLQYLLQAKGLPNLTSLRLVNVGLTHEHLHSINKSIPFSHLIDVDFSENLLGSEGLLVMAQAPWLMLIGQLVLRNNHIQDDAISAFIESPYIRALAVLDLSGNPVTAAGKKMLLDMANEKGIGLILS
jgi:hypothetical protein